MDLRDIQYNITNKTVDELTLDFSLREEFKYFKGHFDDFPLLPALLQIHICTELTKAYLDETFHPLEIPNVKFMTPIFPEEKICLNLRYDSAQRSVNFVFGQGEIIYSKGLLR